MIIAILAKDETGAIGFNGGLPWGHNKDDMKWFRKMTEGSSVVMGRSTWDSLPLKPLPERDNYVLTKGNLELRAEGMTQVCSPKETLQYLNDTDLMAFIIGGTKTIDYFIDQIDLFLITEIKGKHSADTFFQDEWLKGFVEVKLECKNFLEEGSFPDVYAYTHKSILTNSSSLTDLACVITFAEGVLQDISEDNVGGIYDF